MSTHSCCGSPWAKLSTLRVGSQVKTDAGFTCMNVGKHEVLEDELGLYVLCDEGHHYLQGQADDGEHLVGMWNN